MNHGENLAEPITLSALTAGTNIPSSRFRMRQYIPRLAEHGIVVKEHKPFSEKTCYFPGPFKAMTKFGGLFR